MADGVLGHKSADAEKLYYSGKSVFWFTSFPASIFDYPEILENTEVTVHFMGPDGTAVRTSSFSDALMAFSQTKYPEEAKKFVKWWAENSGALYTEADLGVSGEEIPSSAARPLTTRLPRAC